MGKTPAFEAIEKMLVTNTVPLSEGFSSKRIETISVAPLFAQAITSIAEAKSISSLFE